MPYGIAEVIGLTLLLISVPSAFAELLGAEKVDPGELANRSRAEFLTWFHDDAIQTIHPKTQDILAKQLLNLEPPSSDWRSPEHHVYIQRVHRGLEKTVLELDSLTDLEAKSCLLHWAEYKPEKDPAIRDFFKKRGIPTESTFENRLMDAYVLKNYPGTRCAMEIAMKRGYFLQRLPSCKDEPFAEHKKRMDAAELPLLLSGQPLSPKEKALVHANIAYIGEWAWENLRRTNAAAAEDFRKKATHALKQMNDLLPESKKWNDARLEALNQQAGSVMRDCVVPGD